MIRGFIYAKRADATRANDELAQKLGYPKPAIDLPGGVHAPPEQSHTLRAYDVREAADGTFVVPTDAEIEAALPASDLAAIGTVEEKPRTDPRVTKP